MRKVRACLTDCSGVTPMEYALVASIIAIALIVAATNKRINDQSKYSPVNDRIYVAGI
jgi:Flp pilus assembly pilin Flp